MSEQLINLNKEQSTQFIAMLLETPTKIGLPLLQFLEQAAQTPKAAIDGKPKK